MNKRPLCLKESLRDNSLDEPLPTPITPELITNGYELVSVNILPSSEPDDWNPPGSPVVMFENLSEIREKLYQVYEKEFLQTLVEQGANVSNRFKPINHEKLSVGSLVLVKDNFIKRNNFPLARVVETITNSLGEVTDVVVVKGANGEKIKRHVSAIIPYLNVNDVNMNASAPESSNLLSPPQAEIPRKQPTRAAASAARRQFRRLADKSLI